MNLASLGRGIDDRSFEQRFGKRCPLCGKNWSDPGRCGPRMEGDWTIQQVHRGLFADRVNNCEICDRSIPSSRKFCYDCSAARERARNKMDKHAKTRAYCTFCGGEFDKRSDKPNQKTCSRACAAADRTVDVCKRGHIVSVLGRDRSGDCIACRRERQRTRSS